MSEYQSMFTPSPATVNNSTQNLRYNPQQGFGDSPAGNMLGIDPTLGLGNTADPMKVNTSQMDLSQQGGPMAWMQKWLGGGTDDAGNQAASPLLNGINAASGLFQGYHAFQQLKMAKKGLKENRRQFDLNYGAQRQTTNTQLADRQAARVSADPYGYESVSSYMQKNQVA